MRLSEYDKVNSLAKTDTFVLDTAAGTKSVMAIDLATELGIMAEETKPKQSIYDQIDDRIVWGTRRNLWYGNYLGDTVTAKQWDEIGNGTFKGMFLGDYWEIDGRKWRIVDFNYWLITGDTPCETFHLVIMPDQILYTNTPMNDTKTTEGGYVGSKMYKTGLNEAKNIINNAFGASHILNHREMLTNAVTNGKSSSGAWYDSTVELPSEIMIYGSYVFTPTSDGVVVPHDHTINKEQLAGMRQMHHLIATSSSRNTYWLRDVCSNISFAVVSGTVIASMDNANNHEGVRPVFGIKG